MVSFTKICKTIATLDFKPISYMTRMAPDEHCSFERFLQIIISMLETIKITF